MLDISSVVAAFGEDQVKRLTGLSITRLRYWHRTGFFVPAFVEENQRLRSADSTPSRTLWRCERSKCCASRTTSRFSISARWLKR